MIFVDTGAWIALTDRSDQYHADALRIYERIKQQRIRLLTTDYIIDETVTRLRYDSGHHTAVRFLDLISQAEQSNAVRRILITPAILQEAIALFRQYDTAILSLTDCTSFAICEHYKLKEVFGFDEHFLMRGIVLATP